jgi:hypothetical protein
MLQRLTGQLPDWAHPQHPMVRYELGTARTLSRRARILRLLGLILTGVVLFAAGYIIATGFFQTPPGQNLTESLMAILFWPVLAIQVAMQVASLALTVGMVGDFQRRQAWDNLRATAGGIALAVRVRWISVYYRLRGFLIFILLVRGLLILGILYDLTAFQGRYIDLLLNGAQPEVPPLIGALLLAFLMTAALLLPITSLGLSAAFGLLFSVSIQQRTYSAMLQIISILLRTALALALVAGATAFVRGSLPLPDPLPWLLMMAYGGLGDWGLAYLNLGFYSEIWASIPFAIFLGTALLLFSLVQSLAAEWLLALTVRIAEKRG